MKKLFLTFILLFGMMYLTAGAQVTVNDILRLKQAGISDQVITAYINQNTKTNVPVIIPTQVPSPVHVPQQNPNVVYINGFNTDSYQYFYHNYLRPRQVYFNNLWYPLPNNQKFIVR